MDKHFVDCSALISRQLVNVLFTTFNLQTSSVMNALQWQEIFFQSQYD